MSVSSYCKADGIPGPAKGKDVDSQIECYEFRYSIDMPTDIRDGSITGRRQHGFFSMVHELDKSSPLFAKHLCENLEIPSVVVTHFKPDPKTGDIIKYFAHEMKKVKVVGLTSWKLNTCDEASKKFRDMEEVRFMFEEIKIKDEEGNEYTDKWELGA
ncbi:MAG: type VI secretion system tube protein Hcp [Acidobacteria bacterium]|nr:type VI secretion system tube protein Hcp [Acidobacteriota bacterium]